MLYEIFLEIFHSLADRYVMSTAVKERPAKAAHIKRRQESGGEKLARLRGTLGWSRSQLAHVMNASDRAIVNWEAGDPMSPVYAAKLREIQSVFNELKQLMKPNEIGSWLRTEMEEFDGRTPVELISRGETGRLWASLFYLRSGMPD
jgi:DNA-binding transcriptional regulator YiaG